VLDDGILAGLPDRVLLCDTLVDTGDTMNACAAHLRSLMPTTRIDYLCVYATLQAYDRLSQSGRFYCLEMLGDRPCSLVCKPRDIPYDFGDVAESCGLTQKREPGR